MKTRPIRRPLALLLLAAACGGGGRGPVGPPDPGPNPNPNPGSTVSITIVGERASPAPWGEAVELRATTDAPDFDSIFWVSLDDHYLGRPVVLGRGAEIVTQALKPGTTRVEVQVWSGSEQVARAVRSVDVEYRTAWNVALEGRIAWPDETTGDVWVEDGHAYVARRSMSGISIVRLDGGPVEVGRYAPAAMFTQDVKVAGGVAYATNEPHSAGHPWAVTSIDVSDPTRPRELGGVPLAEVGFAAHNVWIDGDLLTLASQGTDRVHLYDVSDPAAPRALSTVASERGTAHDVYTRNGLLFGSYLALQGGEIGEMTIADVSNPGAPVVLSRTRWPGAFVHQSWLSEGGRYLYVLDELVNSPVRIYDVAIPSAPRLVGTYQPRMGTIPHNLLVEDDDTAYIANYKNGVEVLDISDPAAPRLVGFFDTHPGIARDDGLDGGGGLLARGGLAPAHEKGGGVYEGAWGVHWDETGRIVVSDLTSGLWVLRYTGD